MPNAKAKTKASRCFRLSMPSVRTIRSNMQRHYIGVQPEDASLSLYPLSCKNADGRVGPPAGLLLPLAEWRQRLLLGRPIPAGTAWGAQCRHRRAALAKRDPHG